MISVQCNIGHFLGVRKKPKSYNNIYCYNLMVRLPKSLPTRFSLNQRASTDCLHIHIDVPKLTMPNAVTVLLNLCNVSDKKQKGFVKNNM